MSRSKTAVRPKSNQAKSNQELHDEFMARWRHAWCHVMKQPGHERECRKCRGTGIVPVREGGWCSRCEGKGRERNDFRVGDLVFDAYGVPPEHQWWLHPVWVKRIIEPGDSIEGWNGINSERDYLYTCGLVKLENVVTGVTSESSIAGLCWSPKASHFTVYNPANIDSTFPGRENQIRAGGGLTHDELDALTGYRLVNRLGGEAIAEREWGSRPCRS